MTKCSATARSLAASVSNERNPNPRLFFFSWSYIMTTSQTSPYLEKKLRKSVSVMVDGRPPKKTCTKKVKSQKIKKKNCFFKFF